MFLIVYINQQNLINKNNLIILIIIKEVRQMVKRPEKTSCFTIMKSDEFGDTVRGPLGPVMKEVMASDAAK